MRDPANPREERANRRNLHVSAPVNSHTRNMEVIAVRHARESLTTGVKSVLQQPVLFTKSFACVSS